MAVVVTVEDVVMHVKGDLEVAVRLVRDEFGPVATSAMGVLLLEHFPYLHEKWKKEKAELDRAASATLLEWRASRIKQDVNHSFARGDKPK